MPPNTYPVSKVILKKQNILWRGLLNMIIILINIIIFLTAITSFCWLKKSRMESKTLTCRHVGNVVHVSRRSTQIKTCTRRHTHTSWPVLVTWTFNINKRNFVLAHLSAFLYVSRKVLWMGATEFIHLITGIVDGCGLWKQQTKKNGVAHVDVAHRKFVSQKLLANDVLASSARREKNSLIFTRLVL